MNKARLFKTYYLVRRHWGDLNNGQKLVVFWGLLMALSMFSSKKWKSGALFVALTAYLWHVYATSNKSALFKLGTLVTVDPDTGLASWRFPPKPGSIHVMLQPVVVRK